jgi:hypothetical protein
MGRVICWILWTVESCNNKFELHVFNGSVTGFMPSRSLL